jgi:4-diphosphocytidyl-2-C-methyl-D-erythritol kinase
MGSNPPDDLRIREYTGVLVLPAFAKINLALEIVARRPDGYHDLDSIVTAIDWHDLVSLEAKPADRTDIKLFLRGPRCAEVPSDGRNLAVRAAHDLASLSGQRWNIEIAIDKRIPVGAGLGGGSSDAATVIRGLLQLFASQGIAVDSKEVGQAALQLGSDIPALMSPGAVRIRGRGEVAECFASPDLHLVVVATVTNSTSNVYAHVDSPAVDGRAQLVAEAISSDRALPDASLGSALEGPARQANPEFAARLARLRKSGQHQWHVTGSGGGAFTLVAGSADAVALSGSLVAQGWDARACRTVGSTPA